MKRGFTLLELVIVIIIIGVLATLGIQQYGRMVERARGAEARTILGQIRSTAAAHKLQYGCLDGTCGGNAPVFGLAEAGIGAAIDQIPSDCSLNTHYFSYTVAQTGQNSFIATATRCTTGSGKTPGASTPFTLTLTTDFTNGTDVWGGSGGY